MFQQVPMVEIDGMKMVQTKAILNYIAEKYELHGKNIKDRAMYETFLNSAMNVPRCFTYIHRCTYMCHIHVVFLQDQHVL